MFINKTGRRRLKEMWKKQRGACPICGNEVNKESGWKVHKTESNRKVIVHPKCHNYIHSNSFQVAGLAETP